jgi:hypothetical protein
LLNPSQAFDGATRSFLFKQLIAPDLSVKLSKTDSYTWYANQQIDVRWQALLNERSLIRNDRHQGGVLSPHLFLHLCLMSEMLWSNGSIHHGECCRVMYTAVCDILLND